MPRIGSKMAVRSAVAKYGLRLSDFSEVLPDQLYLSGLAPVNKENLEGIGVSVVIRVLDSRPEDIDGIDIHWIKVDDLVTESEELRKHFDTAADLIDEAISSQRKVLVHCRAGVSRSATIVLCYLMKYKDMTLIDAHSFLKKKRSLIRPNLGFWANLVDYEYCLFQKNTVNMIKFKEGWEKIPDIYSDQFKRLY